MLYSIINLLVNMFWLFSWTSVKAETKDLWKSVSVSKCLSANDSKTHSIVSSSWWLKWMIPVMTSGFISLPLCPLTNASFSQREALVCVMLSNTKHVHGFLLSTNSNDVCLTPSGLYTLALSAIISFINCEWMFFFFFLWPGRLSPRWNMENNNFPWS